VTTGRGTGERGGIPFAQARAELLALYAEVDSLLAGFSCPASSDCCHFGAAGREPYPTTVELAVLEGAMAGANVHPRRSGRRSLPVAREDQVCPMLGHDGRCRVYASRPLGCRTFFCERVSGPGGKRARLPRVEIQRISRAIADLSARFAPRDPRARPLMRALGLSG
jgi:Fe-S-cluster containining protein